ncbi:hypothetical protein NEF87_000303 [Candidatus Lokiarchaeum ossiferum]|uniref:Uncharacterized protein n=1 Tax=Candidatus Lokiarchaeum ossiferum TaxID=2951803 RepID=A0ABY6HKH5_9ARCH|nr:hypothetical protein NEF87_000303 [Candidatus Lokiarchaeum sp. B-35]
MFKIKNRINLKFNLELEISDKIDEIDENEKKKINRLLRLTLLHLMFSATGVDLLDSSIWKIFLKIGD